MQLPFDEEHEFSLSVGGANDAFRLEVSAEVSECVWLLIVWLEDVVVALQSVSLSLRLHTGVQGKRERRKGQMCSSQEIRQHPHVKADFFSCVSPVVKKGN